jgi:predicted RND superfamily exporter protein
MFSKIYKTIVIDFSKISLILVCSTLAFLLYFSKDFKLDASSDSLLLESDKDLKFLREVNERYGSKDYLVLTYTPLSEFTNEETIINLQFLKSKIEKLNWVDGIITIIDVPLLKSSDEPLMERLKNNLNSVGEELCQVVQQEKDLFQILLQVFVIGSFIV